MKVIIKGWVALNDLIHWCQEEIREAKALEENDKRFWKGYAAACQNVMRKFGKDRDQR